MGKNKKTEEMSAKKGSAVVDPCEGCNDDTHCLQEAGMICVKDIMT